jgi:hypothetical protein
MLWGWIVAAAFVLLVPSLLVFLVTKRMWPRVSAFASAVMSASLGILCLWMAVDAIQRGHYDGVATSKIFRHGASRDKDPFLFWVFTSIFAVPGIFLVLGGVVDGTRTIRNAWRGQ